MPLRGDGIQAYQFDVYGIGSGSWFESDVAAIATDSTSSVTYSGVPVFGQLTGSVLNDGPGQPYLSLKGRSGLGQEHRVELAADPSQLAVIFVSTDAALVEATDLYGTDIWLALNRATALTPLTPTGFADPAAATWTSPHDPAFLGFQVSVQAGVLDAVTYAWTATNPVELYLGP